MMEYPTYAHARELSEQEAEQYTSKHANELTARLLDHFPDADEQTSHDSLGWCGLWTFAADDTLLDAPAVGAAIVWEHDDDTETGDDECPAL